MKLSELLAGVSVLEAPPADPEPAPADLDPLVAGKLKAFELEADCIESTRSRSPLLGHRGVLPRSTT